MYACVRVFLRILLQAPQSRVLMESDKHRDLKHTSFLANPDDIIYRGGVFAQYVPDCPPEKIKHNNVKLMVNYKSSSLKKTFPLGTLCALSLLWLV